MSGGRIRLALVVAATVVLLSAGLIHLLTEDVDGAVLRIEPAD